MALSTLTLVPDQAGYSVQDGEETLAVRLDGGASRFRRDVLGAASTVRVQWTVGPTEYYYLRAFYRTTTARGTEPFNIHLIMDDPLPQLYKAHFVPGSMKLSGVQGLTYSVEAQLEVTQPPADSEFDASLVELYTLYGEDVSHVLNEFEYIANTWMPAKLY